MRKVGSDENIGEIGLKIGTPPAHKGYFWSGSFPSTEAVTMRYEHADCSSLLLDAMASIRCGLHVERTTRRLDAPPNSPVPSSPA